MHTIFFSKLGKSGVQHFKRCANWSWNEEVMVFWRQPHKVERKLRSCKMSCENFEDQSPFRSCEMSCKITCENFARCFTAAKPPASTRVPFHKLKFHFCSCEPRCEIISKLWTKLQNHLQVAKSQIQLAKWRLSTCENFTRHAPTCKIHLCNLRYLLLTKLDFFLKIFYVNFYFLLVLS